MVNGRSKIGATLAVLASTLLPPAAGHAQDSTLALEEVIVTARKRQESLQNVPVAVTAISAELQQSTVRNLQDIQGFSPNIIIDKVSGTQGGASISIRGISYQEVDKSLDPPIGVIVDGIYLGQNSGQILNNFDIDRIEVIRGPQGTLFGKNTIGGAINIIRSEPTKELGGKVRVGTGSWDQRDFEGLLNLPVTADGGLKLFGSRLKNDGYIDNDIYNSKAGDQNYTSYGATFAYSVTENLEVSLSAEHIDDKSEVGAWANFNTFDDFTCFTTLGLDIPDVPNSTAPYGSGCAALDTNSDKNHNSQNAPNWANVHNDYYNLTANWQLGDWLLTSITGYVNRNESQRLEYDASANEFLYVLASANYEQTSQELRLNGQIGDVNLTAGLYYWYSEHKQVQDSYDMWYYFGFNEAMGLGPGEISQNLTGRGDNTSYAGFINGDWAITDRWVLNLGGRYSWEEKTFKGGPGAYDNVFTGEVFIPAGPVRHLDDNWTEFTPRVALQYEMTDEMMLFGSYSKGYKSGGFFARTQYIETLNSYDPEYVDTYELGMKSQWLENRLRFNSTLFYSEYSDKQEDIIVPDDSGAVGTIVANASDVEMYGAEIELNALVTPNLIAYLQAGYLNSEYGDFEADINGDGVITDNSGLTLRNSPENTFGTGLTYNYNIDLGEFAFHYNYFWRDKYQSIFDNNPLGKVKAAGFHNASIDFTFRENYVLSVYGRNLGNERYARPVLITPVSNFGQYNEPRNYGVELTARF